MPAATTVSHSASTSRLGLSPLREILERHKSARLRSLKMLLKTQGVTVFRPPSSKNYLNENKTLNSREKEAKKRFKNEGIS